MGDEAGNLEGKSLSNLRVVDLKMELEKRGLSKSGSKKDLVKRLKQKLELEKLYEESSAIGESEPKLQLDEATEQNEFVQQYLAEQREIYARQKEVRRLIELKEQEESGGTDDSDSGMKDQDSDVSEGLSLSKSTCDSSAIVEGEDEDHHEQEQKSISRKSESEEVSATPVESASCNQENPCDSTNSPNQPTDGKSEQSDIPTEMESKSRDAVAFSLLDISLPESPKVLSGRSGSKSPRSAVDKLPQKTNSHQPDSVAAEPDNLKTNGSVKKMPRSGKRRWSDAKKTPAQEVSDSTKYAELEAKLATEDVVLKGKLDSKNLNVDDSIMKADTKVDSSNKVEAETISGDTKALPSKPGEDSDVATRSNWKNTDQETSSVSLFPEQVSEVSESNESKGKPSIEAVDEEKNEVGISKKEKKMDSDSEIMGKSKTSNQSVKKVEKHEKFASRSRKTKKQERSSSSSSSSASSRSSSPEMRTSSRRRKGSKSPKARYERDSDVKQRHRDVRHGRDSKHRRGLEKTWSTSPDAKRSRSPNVKQRKEADSKQRKSVRANRSSSSDEKRSKSPDFKQRREADLEKVNEGRGRSPIVMRKKSSHAYSRTPVVRKRSRSPAVTRKKSPRKSSRSPDARRSKSPVVARKKSPHKSSRSPDARRSKSPVVTRKKSPHKSSRSPDARRSKSPVVTRKKSPHKSNSSPDARQSKSPDGNQKREAELKQRRSPVASRSRSPNAKQGSPEVSQSTDLMTDKTTEEKKTHSAKHKSISPNKHTQRSSPLKRRSHSPSPRQGSRPKESVRPRKGQSVSPRKRQSVSPAKIHSTSPQQRQNPSSVKGRSSSPEETQSASLGKSDKKRNVEGEKSLNRDDSSDSSSDSDRRESQRPTPLKPAVLPKKRLSRIAENKVLSEKKIELEPRQPRRPKLNRTSFSMSEDVVMKDVEEKNKEIACLKLNESVVSLQEKVSKIDDMVMEDEKRLSLAAAAAAPEMPPEKISYRKLNTPFKKHEDKDKNLGRKRRWRSSSNMLQNTAMVISSDSLKNLIPEFKLTPVPSKEMDTKSKESENLTGNETAASKVDEANKDEIGEEKVTTPKVAKIDGAHALKAVKASGATSSKITLKEKKKLAEDSVISRPSCSAFSSALRLFKPNKSSIKSSLQGKKKDDETIKKEDLVKKDIDLAKVPALPVDRSEPVPSKPPSCIIFIQNLVRPFTLMQLKNLLNQTGTIVEEGFWIDKIKSKCFVKYETEEEAVKTREALHETRWPPSNPKILSADFSNQDEFDRCSRGYDVPMPPVPIAAAVTTQPDIRKREENLDLTDLRKKRLERHSKDREHSRQNVTYVREWDKDKLTQDSPERDRSRLIKERNRSSERRRETKRADSKKKTLEDTPAKLLDDLFQKTKNTPCIYWLPLTEEQVKAQEEERRQRRLDREKRNQLAREQEAERRAKRKPREKDTRSRSRSRQGRRR